MSERSAPVVVDSTGAVETHGGHLAALALERHGVEVVFTLSGAHLFPLYDGCVKQKIRLVDVRHEQTAVFAAEAWAKVTRRPGVAALTAGPGITNGISAMSGAYFTGSPLLVLGGRAPQARWGQGSLQEIDHVPIVAPVTKGAATCTSTAEAAQAVHDALVAACTPHRGPTFLDISLDAIFSTASGCVPPAPGAQELRGAEPDVAALDRIGRLLAAAQHPVLMVGADVYWDFAEAEMRRLAEEARLPVFMNGLGRGTLAADHELAFSRARSAAFKGADLVLVAGTPLDFRLGFGSFGGAKVVHLADSPERLATRVDLAASAAGRLAVCFDRIRESCLATGKPDRSVWLETLRGEEQRRREAEREVLESDQTPIHPARIYGELRHRLERDAIVIGDGGDFVSYAGKYVDTYTPGCFLDPGPFGCLGTGPGYALGARLAHPHRQVVLLLGDGAAGFSLADFDTLSRFQISVLVILGNNVGWGLEKHPMQQLFGYHVAAELSPEARYDRVITALGGAGEQITQPEHVGGAIERALGSQGPVLLNVMTDPANAYPRTSSLA